MAQNVLFEKYGQTIGAGKLIFSEGEPGNHMYIIQDGVVRITKNIDGKDHVLAELTKGDFFGEMAIVSRIMRTASAVAVTEVQILAFDRQGFQGMIEKNAKIAMNVIDKLCRRLEHANSQIQHLFKKNEQSLVAVNLYHKFTESPAEDAALALDRTVKDISLSLQVPADAVTEVVRDLENRGVVSIAGNALRLASREKLSQLAEETGE